MFKVYSQTGTAGYVDFAQVMGALSAKYFSQGVFEGADKISGSTMSETILTGTSTCQGCFIRCGRVVEIREGKYKLAATKGPEYETVAAFGANLLCDDLAGICLANQLCNSLGLDTISSGVSIGFAYHLFEKGVIDPSDTSGLELKWGEIDPAIALVQMIAHRQGIGDVLAEGVRAMGEKFGAAKDAAQINGLEFSFQDPRGFHGMAVCYATSPRGACHQQADMYMVEIGWGDEQLGIESKDRLEDESKGVTAARLQDYRAVTNSLIICCMAFPTPPLLAQMLTHATGRAWSVKDLLVQGERIMNLKRAFNIKMGFRVSNEKLPSIVTKPLTEGGSLGTVPDLEQQLREYYAYRQWDRKSGKPKKEKLLELELAEVAHDLWR